MGNKLEPLKLKPLKLGELKPTGWLKKQLKTQVNGLSGHLDKFWPDIMDSGWIGGKAEGWERFPYWLDGIIPLAFLLDSEDLIKRIEGYINYILDHQQNEGWFGPSQWGMNPNYDPWPNMILCKALLQYFEVNRDKRIIPALLAYYHKLDIVLDEHPLGYSWAQMRWMDGVWGIYWLIDQLNEDNDITSFLFSLAQKLEKQGYNWRKHFDNFYYIHFKKDPVSQVLYSKTSISPEDTLENQPKGKLRGVDLRSHVVNNAMGIKSSTVWSRQSGLDSDKQAVLRAISTLDRYHGQVTGMFSGDEHFAGKNPSQGTELCSVVEYMFSLETVIPILGSSREGVMLIDRLEKICFNALPATFLPDMWAHQYDQQVNQVQAKRVRKPIYTTNGRDSNVYGLEPNYGCCTANMHQGWPKFVEYGLWAKDNDGLVCLAYSPCKISTTLTVNNRVRVINIEETTNYPFSDCINFSLHLNESLSFSLKFRIPRWAVNATIQINQEALIQCESGTFFRITREWKNDDEITLILPSKITFEPRYNNAIAILRGPLVFSYNPEEEKIEVKKIWSKAAKLRKDDMSNIPPRVKDWEIYPRTPWQYALVEPLSATMVKINENKENFQCFNHENPPLKLKVKAVELSSWGLEFEAALPPPSNPIPKSGTIKELDLIPYGCTNIRITEFPVMKRGLN